MNLNQSLRSIPIFQNLSDSELEDISRKFQVRNFRPHEMIFRQNDSGKELFVIAEGAVQIFVVERDEADFLRPEGRDEVLCTLKPGDYFGEIAVLGMRNARRALVRSQRPKLGCCNATCSRH